MNQCKQERLKTKIVDKQEKIIFFTNHMVYSFLSGIIQLGREIVKISQRKQFFFRRIGFNNFYLTNEIS